MIAGAERQVRIRTSRELASTRRHRSITRPAVRERARKAFSLCTVALVVCPQLLIAEVSTTDREDTGLTLLDHSTVSINGVVELILGGDEVDSRLTDLETRHLVPPLAHDTALYKTADYVAERIAIGVRDRLLRQASAFLDAATAFPDELARYSARVNHGVPNDQTPSFQHFLDFARVVEERHRSDGLSPSQDFIDFIRLIERGPGDRAMAAPIIGEVMNGLPIAPIFQTDRDFKRQVERQKGLIRTAVQRHISDDQAVSTRDVSLLIVVDSQSQPAERTPATTSSPDIAVALTDFIIDRARQELVTRLLLDLEHQLREQEFYLVIPGMLSFLSEFEDLDLNEFVPSFRAAGKGDLLNLATSLVDAGTVSDKRDQILLETLHDYLELARYGRQPWTKLSHSITSLSKLSNCFSRSLRVAGVLTHEWIYRDTPLEIRMPDLRYRITLDSIMRDSDTRIRYFEHLRKSSKSELTDMQFAELLDGVFARLSVHNPSAAMTTGSLSTVGDDFVRRTIEAVDFTDGELCGAVSTPELTEVGVSGGPEVRGQSDMFRMYMRMYLAGVEGQYTEGVSYGLRFLAYSGRYSDEQVRSLRRILLLAAGLAEAKSADEIQNQLHLFADPVGSFVAKRKPGFHATAGAYLGLSAGLEFLQGRLGYQFGGTLPVGVEISHAFGKCCSVGLFGAPVDLGIVTSYRGEFESEYTDKTELKIGWPQVFAPSLYLVLGFPRHYPFGVGVGVQYAPFLRDIDTGASEELEGVLRIVVMLGTDVTLFHF